MPSSLRTPSPKRFVFVDPRSTTGALMAALAEAGHTVEACRVAPAGGIIVPRPWHAFEERRRTLVSITVFRYCRRP